MKIYDNINAPWSLRFERNGTEDIAVIHDAAGDELLRSRPFWLPEGDDLVPPTLAAMRLILAAPGLMTALEGVIAYAEQEATGLESHPDCPQAKAEAERAWLAIAAAQSALADAIGATSPPASAELEVRALLARRGQIAAVWSVEDVQTIRPDLNDEEAWQVLTAVEEQFDANLGITWDTLEQAVSDLFGDGRETGEA